MNTEQLTIELRQVVHIHELMKSKDGQLVRRLGLVYWQEIEGKFLPRVITGRTDGEWLRGIIAEGRIYIDPETAKAEMG